MSDEERRTIGIEPGFIRLSVGIEDEADLLATERKLNALWAAISRARETGDFRPRPGKLCDWCRHKALCPAFGGTLPPMPMPVRGASAAADGAADAAAATVAAATAAPAGVTADLSPTYRRFLLLSLIGLTF